MKRRDIIKGLSFLPLFGIAPTKIQADARDEDDPAFKIYRGFTYHWTGWKTSHDSEKIVGQWLAHNKEKDIRIYSSYPGDCGPYRLGCIFNTTTYAEQKFTTLETSFEEREECKCEARDRLLNEIDECYKELENPPKEPKYTFGFTGFSSLK